MRRSWSRHLPLSQHTPLSDARRLRRRACSVRARSPFNDRLDLTAGARFDYEDKSATLETFYDPPIAPAPRSTPTRASRTSRRSSRSPIGSQPDKTLYATVGRGYKAGGFNSASPSGSEAYGEEHTWHFEGGAKTLWANGRVSANAAVFYIDWDDLQLNVPNPAVPAQFYITNVGGAVSKGVEVEVNAGWRPASTCSPPSATRTRASRREASRAA